MGVWRRDSPDELSYPEAWYDQDRRLGQWFNITLREIFIEGKIGFRWCGFSALHKKYTLLPLYVFLLIPTFVVDLYNCKYFGNKPLPPNLLIALNFPALFALGHILSGVTDTLSDITGDSIAVGIAVFLGNAVELLMSVIGLLAHNVPLVRSSLVGGVISNLLMVFPFCLIVFPCARGRTTAHYSPFYAEVTCLGLLISLSVALCSVIDLTGSIDAGVKKLPSIIVSAVLLGMYFLYCCLQIRYKDRIKNEDEHAYRLNVGQGAKSDDHEEKDPDPTARSTRNKQKKSVAVIIVLVISLFIIWLASEVLVDHIQDINTSVEFKNLILVPIAGNLAEHVCAMVFTCRGRMSAAVTTAFGSSLQLIAFVLPFVSLISQIPGLEKVQLTDLYVLEVGSYFATVVVACAFLVVPLYFFSSLNRPHRARVYFWEGCLLLVGFGVIAAMAWLSYGVPKSQA